MVYHPSAPAIVAGGADKTATVETFSLARSVAVGSAVNALATTPNGSHVLTAGADGKVKLWNAATGANERAFEGGDKPVQAVAVAEKQPLRRGRRRRRHGAPLQLRGRQIAGGVQGAGADPRPTFSANSQMLAAACEDKSVQTWSIGQPQNGLPLTADLIKPSQSYAHAAAAADVAFAPDGTTLYTAGADKTVKQWKVASEAPTKSFQHPSFVDAVAFDKTGDAAGDGLSRRQSAHLGRRQRASRSRRSPPTRWRRRRPASRPAPAPVYCVAWSPDGKQVLSGSLDASLKLGTRRAAPWCKRVPRLQGKGVREGPPRGRVHGRVQPRRQVDRLRRQRPLHQGLECGRRQRDARSGEPEPEAGGVADGAPRAGCTAFVSCRTAGW